MMETSNRLDFFFALVLADFPHVNDGSLKILYQMSYQCKLPYVCKNKVRSFSEFDQARDGRKDAEPSLCC